MMAIPILPGMRMTPSCGMTMAVTMPCTMTVTAAATAPAMRMPVRKPAFPACGTCPFFHGQRELFQQTRQLHLLLTGKPFQQLPGFLTTVPADKIRQLAPLLRQKNLHRTSVGLVDALFDQLLGRQPLDQLTGRRCPDTEQLRQFPLTDPVMLPQQRQNPATAMKPATTMPLSSTAPVKQRGTHPQISENTHRLILHNRPPIHKEPNEIQDNRKQATAKATPSTPSEAIRHLNTQAIPRRKKPPASGRKTPARPDILHEYGIPPDGIPETNIFMRYMRNGEIKKPTFRHGNPHAAGTGRTTGTCGLALLHNPVDFQRDINEM